MVLHARIYSPLRTDFWGNHQQLLRWGHHAAQGMDGQLLHRAVDGGGEAL
jgi:hypothetical protein